MSLLQKIVATPEIPALESDETLGDLRFRKLLSAEDWAALPLPIRRRFSKRLVGGRSVIYAGETIETKMTWAGWAWAQLARLVGAPLPTSKDALVPAVVTVTEHGESGGQTWTRLYVRRKSFPQVIHSSKQFSGPTGLEEYVTPRVGMALTVHVENETLLFRSHGYFVRFGAQRIALPLWLTPGHLIVTHAECGDGQFIFVLEVDHPLFGRIIRQTAAFREVKP